MDTIQVTAVQFANREFIKNGTREWSEMRYSDFCDLVDLIGTQCEAKFKTTAIDRAGYNPNHLFVEVKGTYFDWHNEYGIRSSGEYIGDPKLINAFLVDRYDIILVYGYIIHISYKTYQW